MHKTEVAAQIHRLRRLLTAAFAEKQKDTAYIALLQHQLNKLTH